MTESGCQNAGISSGFPLQRSGFFVRHYPRNLFIRNEEEDWLFQDTNIVDRSPPSLAPMTGATSRERNAASPRDSSILDEDDQIVEIKATKFYRWSLLKELLFLLSCLVTGGAVLVVCSTWPRLYTKLRFVEVLQNDEDAERVQVESMDGTLTLVHIMWICEKGSEKTWLQSYRARFSTESILNRPRMFVWREERFWFNHLDGSWTRRGFNTDITYAEMHSVASSCALKEIGHDPEENKKSDSRERRNLVYGPNQMNVQVPNTWHLLSMEVFKPFFLFQVFSIVFWMCSSYQIYACVVLTLTIVSVSYNVIETRQNLQAVKTLAASECELKRLTLVADDSAQLRLRPVLVSSSELLPGDIVKVEAGMTFPCDLVLLVGQCIVNESMLTGESAPVPKTPLPLGFSAFGQVFRTQSERDGRYKLLSGTKALQVRSSPNPHVSFSNFELEAHQQPASIWHFVTQRSLNLDPLASKGDAVPVAAMVISTAYGTAKGQLVRAILFPKPSKYDFERKLYYFLANLAVYLVFVCAVTVVWQLGRETNLQVLKHCINLVTIAVPPALPLALSIGLSVSFTRLKGNAVYCINPNRIINAGRINTLCFDKTGTLTEDGLSLKGVLPVICNQAKGSSALVNCGNLEEDLQALYSRGSQACQLQSDISDDKAVLSALGLFYTLAASHSISLLDQPAHSDNTGGEDSSDVVGHKRPGWKAWLCRGWKGSGSGVWYSKQSAHDPDFPTENDEMELLATNLFIGDPLEVQMFSKTGLWMGASKGWRYLSRPDDLNGVKADAPDHSEIWTSMHPSVDTVIIPPTEVDASQILAVLRRFDFDSDIRLMSSIVLELPSVKATFDESRIWLLVKGAPESLQEVCDPASVPQDFKAQLQELTLSGYRVLACGYRLLGSISLQQVMVANRSQMETGITFCGFMIMENKLKSETPGVLQELSNAGLREVMVTGDNPLTAISVARQCGPFFLRTSCRTFLINRSADYHLEPFKSGCTLKDLDSDLELEMDAVFPTRAAEDDVITGTGNASTSASLGTVNVVITGRAFSALSVQHDQLIEKFMEETCSTHVKISEIVTPFQMVLCQTNIYSRMSPQNKLDLMRSLQDLGYVVCMTGDGANDSGALKAADVGISIASKAVEQNGTMAAGPSIAAPFNTNLAHIGVVRMVLAEGRCALVNATVMFKYMYFYALIQATAVMVLYKCDINAWHSVEVCGLCRLAIGFSWYQMELADYQYLWADLGLVFPMVLFMPATQPREKLSRGRPESNLLAFPILLSVYGQSLLIILFQAVAQVFLQQQDWYYNPNDTSHNQHKGLDITFGFSAKFNQNSTVSFLFSSFQYVSMATALSQSFGMFRRSPLSNLPLTSTIITLYALCSLFMLRPMPSIMKAFSMVDLSEHKKFLCYLWLMAAGNSLLSFVFERYAVSHKSTEIDAPTLYDEEMKVGLTAPQESSLHKAMVVLRGEGEKCYSVKPVMPDYFHVAKVATPIWTRLASH